MAMGDKLGDFYSPEELEIARLGTGYVANIFAVGVAKSTGATLTDKRLYFSGKIYMAERGVKLKKRTTTHVVGVQDITGTSFIRINPIWRLILAIVVLIAGLPVGGIINNVTYDEFLANMGLLAFVFIFVILLIWYIKSKVTLFIINYPGGSIGFDVRFAGQTTIESFARNIQNTKDSFMKQENARYR